MSHLIVLLIFIAVLLCIILRPFQIREWQAALAGAALLLVTNSINLRDAASSLITNWNVFLFFLGMLSIAAFADSAGFFRWAAIIAAGAARGSVFLLYLYVFAVGMVITAFLSNDATALILTPVVYALVTRLHLKVLPFMFACTFIADTASFLLPVSNPINIIILQSTQSSLAGFLRHLLLPALIVIFINLFMFVVLFKKEIMGTYNIADAGSMSEAIEDPWLFTYTCITLIGVAILYVTASLLRWPLSLVAMSGSCLLALGTLYRKKLQLRAIGRRISWSIFGFIAGMFIIVQCIENIGATTSFAGFLADLTSHNPVSGIFLVSFGTAIGSNLINNVPMAIIMVSALHHLHGLPAGVSSALAAAVILGCDIGPNISIVGSLATIIWLTFLRQNKVEISPLQYLRLGLMVTPIMIAAGTAAIILTN